MKDCERLCKDRERLVYTVVKDLLIQNEHPGQPRATSYGNILFPHLYKIVKECERLCKNSERIVKGPYKDCERPV